MTVIRTRPHRQTGNPGSGTSTPTAVTRVPVRSRLNTVDRLTNRPIPPLTALQAEVLAALTDVPAMPKAVAGRCSLSERQVHSGVYALSAKGLAVRTAGGWRTVA